MWLIKQAFSHVNKYLCGYEKRLAQKSTNKTGDDW